MAALDFPASPTIGQVYAPAGKFTYIYEGNGVWKTLQVPSRFADQATVEAGVNETDPVNSRGVKQSVLANGKSAEWFQRGTGPAILTIDQKLKMGYADMRDFASAPMGTGIRDDLADLQKAADELTAFGGGKILLRPTGAPYRVTDTLVLGNGVKLVGDGTTRFSGETADNSGWTAEGSWILHEHPTNPAVWLQGNGSAIDGVNGIVVQPVPSGSSWTPTAYGSFIKLSAIYSSIKNIITPNSYKSIEWTHPGSAGGRGVVFENLTLGGFHTAASISRVNDDFDWNNIVFKNQYHSADARVLDYFTNEAAQLDIGYCDNGRFNAISFYEAAKAIVFRNETVLGNTHSAYNCQFTSLQFNLPRVCMEVENSTTNVKVRVQDMLQQTGNAFGRTWSDTALKLGSDNVDFDIGTWTVVDAGGRLMDLGAGTGGSWRVASTEINAYSTVSAGQVGFNMAAGSDVDLGTVKKFIKPSGAGARFTGSGTERVNTSNYTEYRMFLRFGEQTGTLTGSAQSLSTDIFLRPGIGQIIQYRLVGQVLITAAAAGSLAFLFSSFPAITVTGIDTSAEGFVTFDTGWTDLAQSDLDSLANLGRLQINGTSGVQWANGSLSLLVR